MTNRLHTTTLDKVREFHTIYDQPIRTNRSLRVPEKQLRLDLITEEVQELRDALAAQNYVEIFDALGDIDYVVQGAVLTFGLDLSRATGQVANGHEVSNLSYEVAYLADALVKEDLGEVERCLASISDTVHLAASSLGIDLNDVIDIIHRSNLTKLGDDRKPIYNEHGKVIKGPNYVPPTEGIRRLLMAKGVLNA